MALRFLSQAFMWLPHLVVLVLVLAGVLCLHAGKWTLSLSLRGTLAIRQLDGEAWYMECQ
jgi:hypothetical protein